MKKPINRTFIQVQIDPKMKKQFTNKLKTENKKITDVIIDWIEAYLKEEEEIDLNALQGDVVELKNKVKSLEQALSKREAQLLGESAA